MQMPFISLSAGQRGFGEEYVLAGPSTVVLSTAEFYDSDTSPDGGYLGGAPGPDDVMTQVGNEYNYDVTNVKLVNTLRGIVVSIAATSGFVFNVFILLSVVPNRKLRGKVVNVLHCHLVFVNAIWCTALLPVSAAASFLGRWPFAEQRSLEAEGAMGRVHAVGQYVNVGWPDGKNEGGQDGGVLCGVYGLVRTAIIHSTVWTIGNL